MDARKRQLGVTTVEFAIVGAVVFVVLFAIIELSRFVYTLEMLEEGTRRAARVGVVCAVGDPAVANAAVFANLPGLSTDDNVVVEYLDQGGAPTGDFPSIRYVRVRIVDYEFAPVIPYFGLFAAPAFSSTLPRESLGVLWNGAPPPC